MKTFRRPATAAAVALGLTAALVVAAPATAEDFYHEDIVLGAEDPDSDRGYPDGIWFTGSSTTGTQTQSEDGLTLTERTMLLYGAEEIPLTGEIFINLVQSIEVDADGPWSLQLPIYYDNESPSWFTTFRPAENNTTPGDLDSLWITSGSSGNYDSGDQLTLEEIAAEIEDAILVGSGDEDNPYIPALLAFGILVDTDWDDTTIRSFTFNGDTHYFTPEPEVVEPPVEEPPVEEPPVVEPPVVEAPVVEDDDTAAPATPVEAEATFTG